LFLYYDKTGGPIICDNHAEYGKGQREFLPQSLRDAEISAEKNEEESIAQITRESLP
jgi:hypothetical protein